MRTIRIKLAITGQVADLSMPFPLYQYSYDDKLINILVPQTILAPQFISHYIGTDGVVASDMQAHTAVKMGMLYIEANGKRRQSQSYYLRYLKQVQIQGVEYALYESPCPEEFTLFFGQGENAPKIIINVVNILANADPSLNQLLTTITSQIAYLNVLPSDKLVTDPESPLNQWDLLVGRVSTLEQQVLNAVDKNDAMRKHDVSQPIPLDLSYTSTGFKTLLVGWYNETFFVPVSKILTLNKTGTVMAVDFKLDENNSNIAYQSEIFIWDRGIVQRTITLNLSNYLPISITDWLPTNWDWLDELDSRIIANTMAISEIEADYVRKQDNAVPLVSSEDFSVSETGALLQAEHLVDIRSGTATTRNKIAVPVTNHAARLFLPQEMLSLEDLLAWKNSLTGQSLNYLVDLSGLPTDPQAIQDYLNNIYINILGLSLPIIDQTTLTDESIPLSYRWYVTSNKWVFARGVFGGFATNNIYDDAGNLITAGQPGLAIGSNRKFYGFFETNGEFTINGLDVIEEQVSNNAADILALQGQLTQLGDDISNEINTINTTLAGKQNAISGTGIPVFSGNNITSWFNNNDIVTLSTPQTIMGQKTFNSNIYLNGTINNLSLPPIYSQGTLARREDSAFKSQSFTTAVDCYNKLDDIFNRTRVPRFVMIQMQFPTYNLPVPIINLAVSTNTMSSAGTTNVAIPSGNITVPITSTTTGLGIPVFSGIFPLTLSIINARLQITNTGMTVTSIGNIGWTSSSQMVALYGQASYNLGTGNIYGAIYYDVQLPDILD